MLYDRTPGHSLPIRPRDITLPSGRYFGPCAGNDLPIAFAIGDTAIDHFTFCDLGYVRGRGSVHTAVTAASAVPTNWTLLSRHVAPDEAAPARRDTFFRPGLLRPSSAIEVWQRPDATICTVELRCDTAQDALTSLYGPRSIALFIHMNDGTGEGGSNLWFLDTGDHRDNIGREGLGLLDALAPRLAEGAVVVTDGALTDKRFRERQPFTLCGINWLPVRTIGKTGRGDRVASAWRVHHIAA